jgi:C-terminal processing protease CtpA/Prc
MKPSHIAYLKKYVSTPGQGVVNSIETAPPAGFLPEEWTFFEITRTIEPSNRYRFSGSLYVLINGGSFSAADDYANAIKRTGLGILVGTNTGGGAAAYLAPVLVRLPASGMIFLLEADLLINPDGSFNELYGTAPDIKLDPMDFTIIPRKAELLGDLWIQKILAETGHVQTASGR